MLCIFLITDWEDEFEGIRKIQKYSNVSDGEEGTKNISNKFEEKESDFAAEKKHKFEKCGRATTTAATIEKVNNHI